VNSRDQYQKACDIADLLLSRGYPVVSYESIDDQIIMRFAPTGPHHGQTIHADGASASFEGFAEAFDGYQREPNWSRR
jgi:hypothetical protein